MQHVHQRDVSPCDNNESLDSGYRRNVQRHELAFRERKSAPATAVEEHVLGWCHLSEHGSALHDSLCSLLHCEYYSINYHHLVTDGINLRPFSPSPRSTGQSGKRFCSSASLFLSLTKSSNSLLSEVLFCLHICCTDKQCRRQLWTLLRKLSSTDQAFVLATPPCTIRFELSIPRMVLPIT